MQHDPYFYYLEYTESANHVFFKKGNKYNFKKLAAIFCRPVEAFKWTIKQSYTQVYSGKNTFMVDHYGAAVSNCMPAVFTHTGLPLVFLPPPSNLLQRILQFACSDLE
uniref:Uncharacterized protein n=1 Tax=Micrurus lemniscatus lemniscatus TaxID=129467 RepID=A0A2D4I1D2_MICLE